jgi:hypothetical protein
VYPWQGFLPANAEPTSQDAKPRVEPGVQPPPPLYITNAGGEPRVKSRVLRPEMWAQSYSRHRDIGVDF